MSTKIEHRANIKFCQRLGKTATETLAMMVRVYGEEAPARATILNWHRRFRDGREELEDDDRSGRPVTARTADKIDAMRRLVRDNPGVTVNKLAESLNVSHGSGHRILSRDLDMRRVNKIVVPRTLTQDQRDERRTICAELIAFANEPATTSTAFMDSIVVGGESWCLCYDQDSLSSGGVSLCQQPPPQSPPAKKSRLERDDQLRTVMCLDIFFDKEGLIYFEISPQSEKLNRYVDVLQQLREAIRRERPAKWASKNWRLLHENVPAHRTLRVQHELAKHGTIVLPHPPNSPDIMPCEYFLYTKIKQRLRCRSFATNKEVVDVTSDLLQSLQPGQFEKCFEDLRNRWKKCVSLEGGYLEEEATS